ncbi:MAG: hypothetical protein KIT22_08320 [Verrucomicrobiae bacterium]|nr:hypothetical protein [Verrucomicrobiae bacterium]
MRDPLLAAWWSPLIPVGMVVLVFLYSALQVAWRRSQRTDNHPPPSAPRRPRPESEPEPEPEPIPRPTGLPPFPRPQIPGWPSQERPARPSAGAPPRFPSPAPMLPAPPFVSGPVREPVPPPAAPARPPVPPQRAAISADEAADLEAQETPALPVRALEAAAGIVDRAASLQARVQEQMHRVDLRIQRPARVPVPTPRRASRRQPAGTAWIRKLRSPVSARQAWIASIIFATPRSLE